MLERKLGAGHLTLVSSATQLPTELGALRKTRGTQGMALGDQPTAGVDNIFSTVGVVSAVNHLASFACKRLLTGLITVHHIWKINTK